MKSETVVIKIDGIIAKNLYKEIIDLVVDLDTEKASTFRFTLPLRKSKFGAWTYLDDERFSVWSKVTVNAGYGEDMDTLISGYITHVKPYFDPDPTKCLLEITGMDGSVIMDREEVIKDWPNKKDSDIAGIIIKKNKFFPEVDDTIVVHNKKVSTIIQRESDMQFLKRLAARNGFLCYVEGDTLVFGKPNLTRKPQPLLAIHFGGDSNLGRISIDVNGLSPANFSMFQVDRMTKKVLETKIDKGDLKILGQVGPDRMIPLGGKPPLAYAGRNAVTGQEEMDSLCLGMVENADWFVTAEGDVPGNIYGNVLMPGRTVTIKGVSAEHSGVYFVSRVTHSFCIKGYSQNFTAKRNAIMLKGTENFAFDLADLPAKAAAAAAAKLPTGIGAPLLPGVGDKE